MTSIGHFTACRVLFLGHPLPVHCTCTLCTTHIIIIIQAVRCDRRGILWHRHLLLGFSRIRHPLWKYCRRRWLQSEAGEVNRRRKRKYYSLKCFSISMTLCYRTAPPTVLRVHVTILLSDRIVNIVSSIVTWQPGKMKTVLIQTKLGHSLPAPDCWGTATTRPYAAARTPPWPPRWDYQRERPISRGTISTYKLCFRALLPPCWNWGNSTISSPGKSTCNAIVQYRT